MTNNKLWGGRFQKPTSKEVDEFGSSIYFDKLMADEDIIGSLAHVKMLGKTGIIKPDEAKKIENGLKSIQTDLHHHKLHFSIANEDIHMNIEKILTDRIGPVAGKLHTARSRNDQVAVDFHLYMKRRIPKVIYWIKALQETLVKLAEKNVHTVMPGYTHLQHAQPISYAHYLMAYYSMLKRDAERFEFNQKHVDVSPLGACALAGTTFPTQPKMTAKTLGFSKVYANSIDAVSDRDFAIEFLSNASILMMHLSRLCEEIVMWCSYEFNYIEISDAYTTGSSIMPQKKNPDMAELIRGKTGRIYGHLFALLTTMKSIPLAYDKDMQEDKEGVFDTFKNLIPILKIMAHMISGIKVHKKIMYQSTINDFSNATEMADYLAAKGIPFRQAHQLVGKMVYDCIVKKVNLQDLSLKDLHKYSKLFDKDVYHDLKPEVAVERRNSYGGTGFKQIEHQIKKAKKELS